VKYGTKFPVYIPDNLDSAAGIVLDWIDPPRARYFWDLGTFGGFG